MGLNANGVDKVVGEFINLLNEDKIQYGVEMEEFERDGGKKRNIKIFKSSQHPGYPGELFHKLKPDS